MWSRASFLDNCPVVVPGTNGMVGWGRCSYKVITGKVGMDSQSYGWSCSAVLSSTPASSGDGCSAALRPKRAHWLFTTEGSIASEYCLHLPQRNGPKKSAPWAGGFMKPLAGFLRVFLSGKKHRTVQTGFLICSQGKSNLPWEGEIRRTAILHGDRLREIEKHSNCLEAQSAPLTASSVCSVAQQHDRVTPLEANTTWRD